MAYYTAQPEQAVPDTSLSRDVLESSNDGLLPDVDGDAGSAAHSDDIVLLREGAAAMRASRSAVKRITAKLAS